MLPLIPEKISTGFPSPAEGSASNFLDLNELLIQNPAATFFVRVPGNSMSLAGIRAGDILIVDRALKPTQGKIVLAILNGEFTVRRLNLKKDLVSLRTESKNFEERSILPEDDFEIWGVVTYVIHSLSV